MITQWALMWLVLKRKFVCWHTLFLVKLVHKNCKSPFKILTLVLFRALFVDPHRLPHIHLKLVLLFFSFFLFFNFNFLRGSIKTEKCTVQTDEIVDSGSKLIASSKTLVIGVREADLLKRAPEKSFLKRLFRRKFEVLNTLDELEQMKARGIDRYVLFTSEFGTIYTAILFSKHAKAVGSVIFASPTSYYESLSVFLMRQSLDKERKRLINSGWLYFKSIFFPRLLVL